MTETITISDFVRTELIPRLEAISTASNKKVLAAGGNSDMIPMYATRFASSVCKTAVFGLSQAKDLNSLPEELKNFFDVANAFMEEPSREGALGTSMDGPSIKLLEDFIASFDQEFFQKMDVAIGNEIALEIEKTEARLGERKSIKRGFDLGAALKDKKANAADATYLAGLRNPTLVRNEMKSGLGMGVLERTGFSRDAYKDENFGEEYGSLMKDVFVKKIENPLQDKIATYKAAHLEYEQEQERASVAPEERSPVTLREESEDDPLAKSGPKP